MKLFIYSVIAAFSILVMLTVTLSFETKTLDSSVLLLTHETGKATAVHIGDGYFLTAAHVLSNEKTINLVSKQGYAIQTTVLWSSAYYDVALLYTTDNYYSLLELNRIDCRPLIFGEELRFKGNPSSLNFISVWGKVSGDYLYDLIPTWHRVLPVNTTIVPGMSGGPALDHRGNVRGINVGGLSYNSGFSSTFTNISFIVSSQDICKLLNR